MITSDFTTFSSINVSKTELDRRFILNDTWGYRKVGAGRIRDSVIPMSILLYNKYWSYILESGTKFIKTYI